MKVSELFESVFDNVMIMESYRDFSRVWAEYLTQSDIGRNNKRQVDAFQSIPQRIEKLLRNKQSASIMASSEIVGRGFYDELAIRNPTDVSSWIGGLRTLIRQSGVDYAVTKFHAGVGVMEEWVEEEIEARTPKYDVVKRTSSFIVFKVHNFAGAKKLRDQVKASWCIGTHNDYFIRYGEEQGNDTYIVFILKSKTGIVCHSGLNPLITNHENDKEWTVRNGDVISTRGGSSIQDEVSDLTSKELYGVLTTCKINVDLSSLYADNLARSWNFGKEFMEVKKAQQFATSTRTRRLYQAMFAGFQNLKDSDNTRGAIIKLINIWKTGILSLNGQKSDKNMPKLIEAISYALIGVIDKYDDSLGGTREDNQFSNYYITDVIQSLSIGANAAPRFFEQTFAQTDGGVVLSLGHYDLESVKSFRLV